MTNSVASLTVAYNAERVLPAHLDSLMCQSHELQEFVVVDNASTDSTGTILRERYPKATVLRESKNLGAGGALAAGLSYAIAERKHDWVWLFDDDSIPNYDALEILLKEAISLRDLDSKIGIVAPMCIHRQTGSCYTPLFWRDGYVKPSPEILEKPIWFADLVINGGTLIHREVIENIGLPRADFFMDFFDFEYCLRARANNYKIAVIREAKVFHEIGETREVRLPGYVNRWMNHAPWREYYIARNMAYVAWSLYPNWRTKRFVLRHLVRHAVGVLLFGSKKRECLEKMAQGLRDGCSARLGIRFLPSGTEI